MCCQFKVDGENFKVKKYNWFTSTYEKGLQVLADFDII